MDRHIDDPELSTGENENGGHPALLEAALLEVIAGLAQQKGLDLSTAGERERIGFVASVLAEVGKLDPENLEPAQLQSLVAEATELAAKLPAQTGPAAAPQAIPGEDKNENPLPKGDYAFLSHCSEQKNLVIELRNLLKSFGVDSWVDRRELPLDANRPFPEDITRGIVDSRWFVVLVTPDALQSKWVAKELALARQKAERLPDAPFNIIVIRSTEVSRDEMKEFLGGDYTCVDLEPGPGGLQAAFPGILLAMEIQAVAATMTAPAPPSPKPLSSLVLSLEDPHFETADGKERATARARLIFKPIDGSETIESTPFQLTAPTGAIEAGELKWYLETHPIWPTLSPPRVKELVDSLPRWGRAMFEEIEKAKGDALYAWRQSGGEMRFTVKAEGLDHDGAAATEEPTPEEVEAAGAATALLALPWELLHDEQGYLFQGKLGVRVRRAMPRRKKVDPLITDPPLRVLVISPRPEDQGVGYIDHRVSVRPLVEALNQLGELAVFQILARPTFDDLVAELTRASEAGQPYHVVHFDGHGVYRRHTGLGALVFEAPGQDDTVYERKADIVDARRLGDALRDHRVPLFFLEACETSHSDEQPDASVAARLLQSGVASVAAMSHSVLVETARRFVGAFYPALVGGHRVGAAMLAGQRALFQDTFRGRTFAGKLELHDWFVPVLYQEEDDPQMVAATPTDEVGRLIAHAQKQRLGDLPAPAHGFIGRSRQLLAAERLLFRSPTENPARNTENFVVFIGDGGEGKTTIACELARWLVTSGRVARAAFASVEDIPDSRAVLSAWGNQLVPHFDQKASDEGRAAKELETAVREEQVVLVLDNVESILPGKSETDESSLVDDAPALAEPQLCDQILAHCEKLIQAGAVVLFTSREALPAPFDAAARHLRISRLAETEAIELVAGILATKRGVKPDDIQVKHESEIKDLVRAVDRHARALVLLTPELARSGMRVTTEAITAAMAELERRHPGQRENSLLASAELSLNRIPGEIRAKLGPLAVLRGGGSFAALHFVLEAEGQEEFEIATTLGGVGLGEVMKLNDNPPKPGNLYLRFDPALAPLLGRSLGEEARAAATGRWTEAYRQLARFLEQQRNRDPHLASRLTLLELPNLLGALEALAGASAAPETVIGMATDLEALLQNLGRPRALAAAGAIRQRAAAELGETWNHAAFEAARNATERLLDKGRMGEALAAAEALAQRALATRESAYAEAPYDLAMAHFWLGRVRQMAADAEHALPPLAEARRRFLAFAEATRSKGAERMASVCLTEEGDCLRDLGRLDEAAAKYEQRLTESDAQGDRRAVAAGKGQLGTVRMHQQRFSDALAAHREARDTFEALGEPGGVATAWHQIGMVHQGAGQLDEAEAAYQQSLAIEVQRGDRSGEACSRGQLGTLYSQMGRREEAVRFFREAADVYAETGNAAHEGMARNNAADALVVLDRLDEARAEVERAIECKSGLGPSVTIWTTHMIRHKLERAAGNPEAAAEARRQAMATYEAARRAGWQRLQGTARLVVMARQALEAGDAAALAELRSQLVQAADGAERAAAVLIPKLLAILDGSRDPALAEDPELFYWDAVELKLWLEELASA